MAVSEQMLAPSRIVDKIWHHHLCYTENYWEVLCERIVGRPLHHNPFTGGDAMRQQLAEAYKRTLVIYREEFRQDPPSKFWPDPARPSRETRTSQYDPDRQVVLPRASILITAALGICFVIIALTQSQLTTLSGSFIAVAGAGLALRSLSLSGLIGGSERGTGVEVGFSCGGGCGGCGGCGG
jgi:hypothetical protein